MDINHIFIIGAGTMGNGIAQTAATSGFTVTCMDAFPEALGKAKATITKSTAKLLEKGQITEAQKEAAGQIITLAERIRAGVQQGVKNGSWL